MAGKIFINYRREDSIGTAGLLHDHLAHAFGRKNLFVDVVGADLRLRLNNELAACQVLLTVISPNWLAAKDEAGHHRLHHPGDFVAIEIAAALAHNIHVVPVLIDGARMPKASELPDSLRPLARRQAVDVRQLHFEEDAAALVERVREALNGGSVGLRSRRTTAVAGVVAAAGVLLVGWIGLHWTSISGWPLWVQTREAGDAKVQAGADAKRKNEEAEQQRLPTLKAEQERQVTAAAEAEARRKNEQAEQQRVAALRAEEERKRAETEARARYSALISQGNTDSNAGAYHKAIAAYNEAIRLDPTSAVAFKRRGDAYANKDDYDRAIADYNEAIRLDPKSALAFRNRGVAYANKGDNDRAIADFNKAIAIDPKSALAYGNRGDAYANKDDYDRAIADYNKAIRLDPKSALAFRNRGVAYANKGDNDRAIADYNKAIQIYPKSSLAFRNRGDAYANKDDNDQAIADYNEAIRLDPKSAVAFRNRGIAYAYKGDHDRAIADYNEAIRLDPKRAPAFRNRGVAYANKGDHNHAIPDYREAIRIDPNYALAFCNRGRAKRNINDASGITDIAKARQLDAAVCR